MRDCESEASQKDLKPIALACMSAPRIAIDSAIRGEKMFEDVVDPWRKVRFPDPGRASPDPLPESSLAKRHR
ncbi:unnamed protein product [Arabis nemorensis]|uniref:Uncharacterized protein n=1 Tax=Arabis nemorensis TaxID=586526 RepID=A0A565B206_9BRAS|nr:unnamed protein product [Arabis nemorensis]